MSEEINEPVQVIAKFAGGKLIPFLFSWRGRNYQVKKVEFVHFFQEGAARIYFFSTVGKGANYQLIFNSLTFTWRLARVEPF